MKDFFSANQRKTLKLIDNRMYLDCESPRDFVVMITFISVRFGEPFDYTMPATIEYCKRYCSNARKGLDVTPIKSSELVYLLRQNYEQRLGLSGIWQPIGWKNLSLPDKIDKIIERDNMRHYYYVKALQLCKIVEERHLRMVVENPYNAHHYWRFNFLYKPAVIDMNRRTSGDFYKKPTQYLFVNCKPTGRKSVQMDKEMRFVNKQSTVNRSMISEDYAHNFICDHILEIESGHTQPTLFN